MPLHFCPLPFTFAFLVGGSLDSAQGALAHLARQSLNPRPRLRVGGVRRDLTEDGVGEPPVLVDLPSRRFPDGGRGAVELRQLFGHVPLHLRRDQLRAPHQHADERHDAGSGHINRANYRDTGQQRRREIQRDAQLVREPAKRHRPQQLRRLGIEVCRVEVAELYQKKLTVRHTQNKATGCRFGNLSL